MKNSRWMMVIAVVIAFLTVTCKADDDTLGGLFCNNGQVAKWDGSAWTCADADSGGDITAVTAGTGLSGGGTSGDVTLWITDTYQLPQTCSNGQVAKWNNSTSTWDCDDDSDTTYSAGDGLNVSGTTFQIRQDCANNQVVKWNGADWVCGTDIDTDTTYTAGNQLNLVGTTLNVVEGSGSGLDADTVDGYHASSTPTANSLIALDASAYLRVPRVLDSNNTAYYVDPASISNLNVVKGQFFGVNVPSGPYGYYVADSTSNDIDCGVRVDSADTYGLYVGTVGKDGVRIINPGDDGLHVNKAADNGIEIANAGGDGVYVGSAGDDGVYIHNASDNGLEIDSAGAEGVSVGSASNGLYVRSAKRGVLVNSTTDDGIQVTSAGDDGIYVSSAADRGVYVRSAGGYGVHAVGTKGGGYFDQADSPVFAVVASEGFMIAGFGIKAFVQEHPADPSQVIVYTTLEGGEAGTYYRGSAQLQNGTAVIELPEHFSLVTEEEGLTVQVTAREDCKGLYVAQVTTSRIVVKELQGGTSNARFDFFINGIRAGYEDYQVIRDASELPLDQTR